MDNTILIQKYLNKEMIGEEMVAFEKELSLDAKLRKELLSQQAIISAAENAGLKTVFATEIKRRIRIRKYKITFIVICVCIVASLLYIFKNQLFDQTPKNIQSISIADTAAFINPPNPAANVPFKEYKLTAEVGDTIYHPSGSILYFPSNAFKDKNGDLVKGEVIVQYREFSSALDIFVSGIPMQYDSAGKKYVFESSGMCEINAYQQNNSLFVNTAAQPEIYLSSTNKSTLHNLYYLDTVNRKWNFIGKDVVTNPSDTKKQWVLSTAISINEFAGIPTKPIMPAIADENKQSFSIEIEPNSFEELYVYDKVKMQVLDESNYKRADAEEHWDGLNLEHTQQEGVYNISFYNSKRTVNYKVQPVLEGRDYEAAKKVFIKMKSDYDRVMAQRKLQERQAIESIDKLAEAKKQKVERLSETNTRLNEFIIARKKMMAISKSNNTDIIKANEIIRSFSISSFGIWNCDHPQYPDAERIITGVFKDHNDQTLFLKNVSVVYKSFNCVTQYFAPHIRIIPEQPNMIWAMLGNDFYYFTYEDYAETKLTRATKEYLFTMRKSEKEVRSYNDLKELVKGL